MTRRILESQSARCPMAEAKSSARITPVLDAARNLAVSGLVCLQRMEG